MAEKDPGCPSEENTSPRSVRGNSSRCPFLQKESVAIATKGHGEVVWGCSVGWRPAVELRTARQGRGTEIGVPVPGGFLSSSWLQSCVITLFSACRGMRGLQVSMVVGAGGGMFRESFQQEGTTRN